MKMFLILMGLATLTGSQALAQNKKSIDPSVSVRNYKHADKADYAKKNNLENNVTIGESETVSNDYYKHSNKQSVTKKVSMKVKNKPHPNYKHP